MSSQRQLLLGAFFVIVLSILGYYTLFMTDFSLFGKSSTMVVYFPEASGLRTGDAVLVAGIRKGRVGDLVLDSKAPLERRVTVTLIMDEELELRESFKLRIEESTLLGGRQVYIDPGPASDLLLAADAVKLGKVAPNPLADLGSFVDENRAAVRRIVTNLDELVGGVRAGHGLVGRVLTEEAMADTLVQGLESFRTTADNAAQISAGLREGQGVIGRLLTDQDLEARVQEIADNLAVVSKSLYNVSSDLDAGRGLAGRLLKDENLGEDAALAVRTVREIVDRINQSDGTLWRLIVDPTIADDVQAIITRVSNGEGSLGKLMSDEAIYERLSEVADNLARASNALVNGEGSLGRLLMEPDLYLEVERAMGIVTRSLEEFREAAPVTTFTSVLFGAF
jgi:phospholipid/cholesterol/gamma-HCH transport system substrate-binding protein